MNNVLLTDAELSALARARVRLGRVLGNMPGLHPSPWTGLSLEFADHRPYQAGDDYRLIDWAVYARLRRLVTKVFTREAEAPLYLLLDASASMGQGDPPKIRTACRLAAALAFIAHRNQDRLVIHRVAERRDDHLVPRRERETLVQAFRVLNHIEAAGETSLDEDLLRWARIPRAPGACVVLSDFLTPDGYADGLRALRHQRHQVTAVQVLADVDLDPPRLGEVRLWDVETGHSRSLVLGREAWRSYQAALHSWNERLNAVCQELGIERFLFRADVSPVEAALTMSTRGPR
ncbi:MAG: DUF58 domain-containing protein [Candidatus Bipolaricaulota bacterium]